MNFDRLAPVYRGMERMMAGGLLQRCRTAFLAEAAGRRRALLLGEGPGRFLVELLRTQPDLEITCVERSPAMIRAATVQARRGRLNLSRVRFESADALAWVPPAGGFDLIASHFFLDCFPPAELAQLVRQIGSWATANARWLLADFQIPARGWRRLRATAVHRLMYAFFRAATGLPADRLTPPDPFLQAAGFRLKERRHFNFGLLHSDLWQNGS